MGDLDKNIIYIYLTLSYMKYWSYFLFVKIVPVTFFYFSILDNNLNQTPDFSIIFFLYNFSFYFFYVTKKIHVCEVMHKIYPANCT